MKRILVIPVLFLYILAVSGIMIHIHYCGQVLESWSVYAKSDGCDDGACGDESEEADSCCKDKIIASKISQDQHITDGLKLKQSAFSLQAVLSASIQANEELLPRLTRQAVSAQPNAPPGPWQQIPLYKLHSRLTYYG